MTISRIRLLFLAAAVATVIPGILHLNMGLGQLFHLQSPQNNSQQGNFAKSNSSTSQSQQAIPTGPPSGGSTLGLSSIFFIVAGIIQIFWALPMIRRWGSSWYYAGIAGTAVLMGLWTITRLPGNPITSRGAPVTFGIYDEIFQAAFIAITAAIVIRAKRMKRLDSKTASEAI